MQSLLASVAFRPRLGSPLAASHSIAAAQHLRELGRVAEKNREAQGLELI
jgi:hypothetical protein